MSWDSIVALEIGSCARKLLNHKTSGRVIGITSRGIFLHLDNDWIIFLSTEKWRGPLSINLSGQPGSLNKLSVGSQVTIDVEAIDFWQSGLTIDLSHSGVWQAPSISYNTLTSQGRSDLFFQTIRGLTLEKNVSSLNDMFEILRGKRPEPQSDDDKLIELFCGLITAFQLEQQDEILSTSHAFLGRGDGLTPAGDDLALGMLLTLQRWGAVLVPWLEVEKIRDCLPGAARQSTTTLSANLIECASHGEADERLISALDGFVTGRPGIGQAVNELIKWGGSSGGYVLCGMGAVFAAGV